VGGRSLLRNAYMFGAIACVMVAAAPAAAAVDDVVAQALALEAQAKPGEAYALLAPLVGERAGDPDYDYALGIAAADTGHSPEAILAFQRVLAIQPNNAQARAELARVYALTGDVDTARAQFDTVIEDPSLPDPVRQRFNRIVRDLDRARGGGTSVTGFAEASAGIDTNVNTATNLTSITLPVFAALGPANLSGGATRIDDAFLGGDAGISVASGVSQQTRLFASLLGSIRDNRDTDAFDQGVATATTGFGYTLANRDIVSLSGQAQQFWLAHDRYRFAYGPTAQYTHRLAGGRALSIQTQWLRLDYRTDPLRDADRLMLSLSYAGKISYAALSGGHEETRNQASDNLSNSFAGVRGGFEKPVGRASIVGGFGVEYRHYDDADPLFLKRRSDWQLDASAGVRLLLAPHVFLRPSVAYTRNISNIDLFEYGRFVASVGLRVEF